jgi:hypothetical protein
MQAQVGIGASVSTEMTKCENGNGSFKILSVLPGGAADADGKVLVGDRIVAVNGETLTSFEQMKTLLLGAPGTSLTVELLRNKESASRIRGEASDKESVTVTLRRVEAARPSSMLERLSRIRGEEPEDKESGTVFRRAGAASKIRGEASRKAGANKAVPEIESVRLSGMSGNLAWLNGIYAKQPSWDDDRFCLQGVAPGTDVYFSKSTRSSRWILWDASASTSVILAIINCDAEMGEVIESVCSAEKSAFFSVIHINTWQETHKRDDVVRLQIADVKTSTCAPFLSFKASTAFRTIHSFATRVQNLRKQLEDPWKPDTVADFQGKHCQLVELARQFSDAAVTELPKSTFQQIKDETLKKMQEVAKQKESAAASVPKTLAHVAAEQKRKDVARDLALTSDKIDKLRRQLQIEESNLRAAQTELDATDANIESHAHKAAELLLRNQKDIAEDLHAAIASTNALYTSFTTAITQLGEKLVATIH